MSSDHAAMTEVELLDQAEVATVRAAVHAQRPLWIPRGTVRPFYTLGAASYLDARGGRFAAYQEQAQQMNPILVKHFGWLLDRVRAALSTHVNAAVHFDDRLARPGFHIFRLDSVSPYASADVHYDQQYALIDWSALGTPDASSQLSVTLAIALPASGGGLLLWNINRLELDRMPRDERLAHATANRVATLLRYAPGRLVIHSGHQLHQIAGVADQVLGDERITLQAHALRVNGEWVIYW